MVVMPSGYYYFGGYDMNAKELTVLMVEPGKHPKVTKLKDDLDSLQKAVSISADYQNLFKFANFTTETRRQMVSGRGVEYPFNRRYRWYHWFCGKTSSPALRIEVTYKSNLECFFLCVYIFRIFGI